MFEMYLPDESLDQFFLLVSGSSFVRVRSSKILLL